MDKQWTDTTLYNKQVTKNNTNITIQLVVAGFFGFNGVGHIYLGKTAFGIGIMVIGWILLALMWIGIIGAINKTSAGILPIIGIAYLGYWIWQAYDTNKKAKYFNQYIRTNGKEPW
jgi:hypothetical protein